MFLMVFFCINMFDSFVWDRFPKHPMLEMLENIQFFFSLTFINLTMFFIKIFNKIKDRVLCYSARQLFLEFSFVVVFLSAVALGARGDLSIFHCVWLITLTDIL